jgi:hypothetical protein
MLNLNMATNITSEILQDLTKPLNHNVEINNNHSELRESRLIRFMLIKYKCVLLITFLILCMLQFVYILVSKSNDPGGLLDVISVMNNFVHNISKLESAIE